MNDFGSRGFTVLHVENGLATPLEQFEAHVREAKIEYPALHDGAGANTARYGVRGSPSAFVLNKNGKVVWEGPAVGPNLVAAKKAIEKALGS